MLNQITDSFFSKLMEKLVDYVFETFMDKKNLESTLETIRNNLISLSDKAFDVEEKIKNAELFCKKKRKREVEEWLKHVNMIKNEFRTLESEVETQGFLRKFINGDQAAQLNAKVHQLVEQGRYFGELVVDVYETRGEALLTTNLFGKGFKENLKRIWNSLKSDNVSSIGIYGMGGVGKTALARHINNMILEKRNEKHVCWITVSQVFSIKKLQEEIAHSIGFNDLSDEDNEDKRAARLHRAIRNNFVLILDDVWENICLQKLGDPLGLEGCKLILTTRSFEVCCQMGCKEKVEVEKLRKDEAWNLFKQKLGQDIALAPEVEEIAKSMVKVCGGLPLGIIVLAGSMRGETSIHVWRNEMEKLRDPNMVQDDKEDEVFKILKYSFDGLDLNHQLCFLYCSLYPEDFSIYKAKLVKRFISEELVDIRKSTQSQLDQGYSILNKLVKVCLLESVSELSVKMHDLVRAMALKITKRKYMVISRFSLKETPSEGEWIKDLEKVSLMHNGIMEIPDGMSPNCPKLTTLILHHNPLKFIPDSFFSRLDNLCFLDLSNTRIEKLPKSLSNMENLKALNLSLCGELVDIPNLGKLKKLRELDLSGTSIKKLPQGMEELVNLRFLLLDSAIFLDILPKGLLLNFPYLQCLRLPYEIKAPIEEIVKLKHLEEFLGGVENVSDFSKYIRYRQTQLTIFRIIVNGGVIKYYGPGFIHEDNKNEVIIYQCDLKYEEAEDMGMLVHDIHFLTLHECKGLSNSLLNDFSRMKKPSSLKVLKISRCTGIEGFLTNKQFLMASQESKSHFLPLWTLEEIKLCGLQNFIGLIHKIGLAEFQNLEKINIGNCHEIEEIIEVREREGLVVSLPKLKELCLWDLPRLKSICNAIMFCGSIEYIRLTGCRELKKLPLHFDPTSHSAPQTLKQILIGKRDREWWESLEWKEPTHNHLLQPMVKFL
ncbi:Apoptotic ATPase [Handroanthus impetiginosus]|uniref:Apoptotic ATPase n=1 Tax=Handroanthus impetiginosus TaxID=429701 RepID=A0A2G9HYM7_9LAMI|nr:Apoptotic ATPase [Handroanthus impetiginosus]